MIHVVAAVCLEAPVDQVWAWLADLEWLATVNVFHRAARFAGAQRRGVGTRLILEHGLPRGPTVPRLLRVTHCDEPRRIRWTEVDPRRPTHLFPNSQQFSLAPLGTNATRLVDEVRGTLNLPILRDPLDEAVAALLVRRVVRLECATLRRRIVGDAGRLRPLSLTITQSRGSQ